MFVKQTAHKDNQPNAYRLPIFVTFEWYRYPVWGRKANQSHLFFLLLFFFFFFYSRSIRLARTGQRKTFFGSLAKKCSLTRIVLVEHEQRYTVEIEHGPRRFRNHVSISDFCHKNHFSLSLPFSFYKLEIPRFFPLDSPPKKERDEKYSHFG